jgi:hypothetical protein
MLAHGVTPILDVSDIQARFAWFARLGWTKGWDWGEPPTFGVVRSGRCEMHVRHPDGHVFRISQGLAEHDE